MSNKYCNIDGTKKIKDTFSKITDGFTLVEADVVDIGNRIDTIITTPIDGAGSAEELLDARGGEVTLGVRLNGFDAHLADTTKHITSAERESWVAKADKTYADTQLALKANQSDLNTTNSTVGAKADKSYVDTQILALSSGSPKGVYATLTALQTAFPTGNANIYLVTADGKWYYWNGTAWTAGGTYQSTGIAEKSVALDKLSFYITGKNLFDKSKATVGYFINEANGILAANAAYTTSDFIPVNPSTQYARTGGNRVAYYDSSKAFISAIVNGAVTTPSNCAYIRFSWTGISIDIVQFEIGSAETAYEAYKQLLPKEILEDKIIDAKHASFVGFGKNLFDESTATVGYVVNEVTGAIYANASYCASEYIEVEPSTQYTESTGLYQAYYNSSKAFISGLAASGTPSVPRTITTPSTAKYIKVSTYSTGLVSYQLEKGNIATAYEKFGYKFIKELPNQGDFSTELVLPPKIDVLVGQELNIYFDNIINDKDIKYDFDVTCTIGGQYDNYYRVTPTTAGTYSITIKALQDGIERATVTSSIVVTAASVGNAVNKKVLIIGDSTSANGICTQKLLDNFNTDVMDVTLIGTKGIAPNKHEGISGWTANQFYTDATGPFVFSGAFNFGQYITTNALSVPDYVFINLGINDTFSYQDDASLNTKIATILTQYQGMIDSIKAYNANIKVGLVVTIPPAYSQDSFGKIYGNSYTRWRYKRNNFLWIKALINQFKGKEAQGIYLIPINTNLDTRYNMGIESLPVNARNTSKTVESTIANGNVHPADSGYWQIADVYWFFLKSFEV